MTDEVVIKVENLWKQYGLPLPKVIKKLGQCFEDKSSYSPGNNWALKDISFEVKKGEMLGIIGRNGVGKSTLLKILAGVTPATRGRVKVKGRIFPMIELNAGIHPELTGRENVRLLGAVMGFSRKVTENRMSEIEEFTELGKWFDKPVRIYSSGMLARLGFGVAVNVDADILLVDEVLSVGDLEFQTNCHWRIRVMRDNNITTIFVTHDVRVVRNLCTSALALWDGEIAAAGEENQVVDWYLKRITEKVFSKSSFVTSIATDDAKIDSVEILNCDGEKIDVFSVGQGMIIRIVILATREVESPCISVSLHHIQEALTASAGFQNSEDGVFTVFKRGTNVFDLYIENLYLSGGDYFLNICVHKSDRYTIIAWRRGIDSFRIQSMVKTAGAAYLPHKWQFG